MSLAEPVVMGILNCTPDSFYADSRKQTEQEIAERAQQILAEGGRIIDVGAYSTRPGHEVVSEEEEMHRLQAALTVIRREVPNAVVSVDTFRPLVARRCVEEWGADMVNDVSDQTHEVVVVLKRPAQKAAVLQLRPSEPNVIINVDYDARLEQLSLYTPSHNLAAGRAAASQTE